MSGSYSGSGVGYSYTTSGSSSGSWSSSGSSSSTWGGSWTVVVPALPLSSASSSSPTQAASTQSSQSWGDWFYEGLGEAVNGVTGVFPDWVNTAGSFVIDNTARLATGIADGVWSIPSGIVSLLTWGNYSLGSISDLQRMIYGDTVADINGSGWVYSTGHIIGVGIGAAITAPYFAAAAAAGGAYATVGLTVVGGGLLIMGGVDIVSNWRGRTAAENYQAVGGLAASIIGGIWGSKQPMPFRGGEANCR